MLSRGTERTVDIVVALVLLLLVLPLLILIALALKLERPTEPVCCREIARGRDGRYLSVLKFRTTVDEPARNAHAQRTRTGQWLHYTRMADLPQLVGLLRGEFTLMGSGTKLPLFDW